MVTHSSHFLEEKDEVRIRDGNDEGRVILKIGYEFDIFMNTNDLEKFEKAIREFEKEKKLVTSTGK